MMKELTFAAELELKQREILERHYCNGLPVRDLKPCASQIVTGTD